ncbi:hypothetical protein ACPA9J_03675 [Pseudomonas aeruginosa]
MGLANLPGLLRGGPAGFAGQEDSSSNHGITHDEEGWSRTVATGVHQPLRLPRRRIDCVSNIQLGMERSGFEIHDVEGLRPHYALTLRSLGPATRSARRRPCGRSMR